MIIRVQQKFGIWRIPDLDLDSTIADVIKRVESKPACNGLRATSIFISKASKDPLEPSSTLRALELKDGHLLRAELKRSSPNTHDMKNMKSIKDMKANVQETAKSEGVPSGLSSCIDLTSSPSSYESPSPQKKRRRVNTDTSEEEVVCLDVSGSSKKSEPTGALRFLTYNVWFDSLESERRTREQLYIIRQENPHFVAFQELQVHTAMFLKNNLERDGYNFYLQKTPAPYFCALASRYPLKIATIPFANSRMGRGLLTGVANVDGKTVVVATTHLESPVPPFRGPAMMLEQRKAQIGLALGAMKQMSKNLGSISVLMGDMNWKDKDCGSMPLKETSFKDAWIERMGDDPGFTYDGRNNQMLTNYLRARLDRVLVEKEAKIESIRLVGTKPIENLTYEKHIGKKKELKVLPVLPSDHFGLLTTLAP